MILFRNCCDKCEFERAEKLYRVWNVDGVVKATRCGISKSDHGHKVQELLLCGDCVEDTLEATHYDGDDFQCPDCGDWWSSSYTGDDGEDYCICCIKNHLDEEDNTEEDNPYIRW